jgi:hypothetical protein
MKMEDGRKTEGREGGQEPQIYSSGGGRHDAVLGDSLMQIKMTCPDLRQRNTAVDKDKKGKQ